MPIERLAGMIDPQGASFSVIQPVAFMWEQHPSRLAELLGDLVRLAPLPLGARHTGRCSSR